MCVHRVSTLSLSGSGLSVGCCHIGSFDPFGGKRLC